jgi:hypothetical protein
LGFLPIVEPGLNDARSGAAPASAVLDSRAAVAGGDFTSSGCIDKIGRRSQGATMKFPADAATYKAWCDRLVEGLLISFCVIMALFLTGPIKDALVAVIGDTPIFSTVKCGLVERALSSPYFPGTLKERELGIRYRTGCHKN